MLLRKAVFVFQDAGNRSTIEVVKVLFILLSISVPMWSNSKACEVRFAAYDPVGEAVGVAVLAVAPESDPSVNLLRTAKKAIWLSNADTTINFLVPSIVSRAFTVELVVRQTERRRMRVVVMQCPQRISIRVGELADQFGDFSFSEISGRVTGCDTRGDWWVRAMPMFGGTTETGYRIFEGMIKEDGAFRLAGHLSGERHILVIGREKSVLRVTTFNFIVGGKNRALHIDMGGACSPE
jgi:hypothetical protein